MCEYLKRLFRMSVKKSSNKARAFDVSRKSAPKQTGGSRTSNISIKPLSDSYIRRPRKLTEKKEKSYVSVILATLALLLCASGVYASWQPTLRIQTVDVQGEGASEVKAIVEKETLGTIGIIFPRDSSLFFPEERIVNSIKDVLPQADEVTVARNSFQSLYITVTSRESAFVWCGDPDIERLDTDQCYFMDKSGFVFREAGAYSEIKNISQLTSISTKLTRSTTTDSYPLRASAEGLDHLPNIATLVQRVSGLLAPVTHISIRTDEVDLLLEGGTRVTYVIDEEEKAESLLRSSLPELANNLAELEYIDARFDGKVYVKRKGSVSVNE